MEIYGGREEKEKRAGLRRAKGRGKERGIAEYIGVVACTEENMCFPRTKAQRLAFGQYAAGYAGVTCEGDVRRERTAVRRQPGCEQLLDERIVQEIERWLAAYAENEDAVLLTAEIICPAKRQLRRRRILNDGGKRLLRIGEPLLRYIPQKCQRDMVVLFKRIAAGDLPAAVVCALCGGAANLFREGKTKEQTHPVDPFRPDCCLRHCIMLSGRRQADESMI